MAILICNINLQAAAVAAASGGDFAHVVLAAGIAFVSVGAWDKVGDICKPLKAAG